MAEQPNNITDRELKIVQLPMRPFLFTLDQIETLTGISENALKQKHCYLVGRTPGRRGPDRMLARNIAASDNPKPDWRIVDKEFVRWMKHKGFRVVSSEYTLH